MSLIFAEGVPGLCALLTQADEANQKRDDRIRRTQAGENVPDLAQAIQEAQQAENALKTAQAQADALPAPRTHVLIIGVGDYPRLLNGSLFQDQPALLTLGLGQLTTSLASAMAFADWILNRFHNPQRPLGTVELLLSPGVYKPSDEACAKLGLAPDTHVPVERATLANIKAAFDRWHNRCNARNTTAFFYFCGHGVEKAGALLLPEDFGAEPLRPFDHSIDLLATHQHMGQSPPDTQCFFIDACREEVFDLQVAKEEDPGVALKGGTTDPILLRDAPIFFGSASGHKAFGVANQVTFFTQILLRCLNGLGAERKQGNKWVVTTSSLRQRIMAAVLRENRLSGRQLTCDTGAGTSNIPQDILVTDHPVPVLATVMCLPETALSQGDLYLLDKQNQRLSRGERQATPWLLEVVAGQYAVGAEFDAGADFPSKVSEPEVAYPPEFTPILDFS
jgi:hypothetical protein